MVKSMTGFGRYEFQKDHRRITVEMKSVNHRYLDLNFRMPKKFNPFEGELRSLLKQHISRGKVDIYISFEDADEGQAALRFNQHLAGEYCKYLGEIATLFQVKNDVTATMISRYPEVLTMEAQELDESSLWDDLKVAIIGAHDHFVNARLLEGENLAEDIIGKLDGMEMLIFEISKKAPEMIEAYRSKLTERVQSLLGDTQIDEARLTTEVVIFADKIATDEEIVRLRSHIEQMRNTLHQKEGVGRKLDFIAQEMNREANTILSKANNRDVSNLAIDLKTDIEKIREQIQNIE